MGKDLAIELDRIPRELNLIIKLLNNDPVSTEQVKKINWDNFIDLSIHHRLYPVLYPKARQLPEFIPAHITRHLFQLYQTNTFQMLQLTAEMESVSKFLTENNTPVIFLKGPMIGHELYGDISRRTCSDLDFLIPVNDLLKVEKLLAEEGYVKDDYIQTVLNDWKWRHHHVAYYHHSKGIKLEIHWRLHPGPGKEPSFSDLWDRKSMSSLTKYPVYMLGEDDLLIYLAAHGARHGWSRLRWLLDIHQLLIKHSDFTTVLKLSQKYYMLPVLGQSVVLSSTLLNSKQLEGTNSILENDKYCKLAQNAVFYFENMVNLHTDPVPAEVSEYHEKYLLSMMSLPQKLLMRASFLFPYPEDAETLPLPKPLHFLYFPLRPFLWGWRKTRKHASTLGGN